MGTSRSLQLECLKRFFYCMVVVHEASFSGDLCIEVGDEMKPK